MTNIIEFLKELPNHRPPGPEWLGRADAGKQYPYYAKVFAALKPESILEVGTFLGYSLSVAAATLPGLKRVEWVDDESYVQGSNQLAAENITAARNRAGHQPLDWHWTRRGDHWVDRGRMPNLVHIDGDHSRDGVLHDLHSVWDHEPEWVIGHDYTLEPGVREAVEWFCDERGVVHLSLPDFTHGLWVMAADWVDGVERLAAAGVGRVTVHPPAGKG